MPPRTRQSIARGSGLPTTPEELAQLIEQHVNVAIEHQNINQGRNTGNETGNGTPMGTSTRTATGNPLGSHSLGCNYKTFQGCGPKTFTGAEGPLAIIRWIEKMESVMKISSCSPAERIKYGVCSFQDEALEWWNSLIQNMGEEAAYGLSWEQLKDMLLQEYCPRNELQKIEYDFWHLTMEGADVNNYMSRFNALARLVPRLVNPEYVRIERYIWGLALEIRGMVTSSKPDMIQSACDLAKTLTDDVVRKGILVKKDAGKKTTGEGGESEKKVINVGDNKRKWTGNSGGQFKKGRNQGSGRLFVANSRNTNQAPRCNTCGGSHYGACKRCHRCNRFGHLTQDCYDRSTDPSRRRCYECGIEGNYRNECPKIKGQISKGKASEMNAKKARKDSSVVTGTFLVNNHYAYVLLDTGADLSFVSKQFEPLLGIKPSKLEKKYSIELANGKLIKTCEIIQGCTIQLENRKSEIDLLPVELGSFDIVVGMDRLSRNQAEIVCSEKLVRITIPNGEILSICGDQSNTDLKFVNVMKARKMLRKGYPAFLAHVVDTQAKERKLEDIPVFRDFPEVFPEDLPGLPPERQVEFRIDLVQDAAPVAKSPYRLAPSEMQEMSNQLQELLDKGFIRPSFSP
ncbi:uncharacterized protein LOC143625575 [Bidens hawaiensis]|uniref:uncharacterized protein LOC143625575 n=1 Tax=Bidens hawaiensis TaxID=980011 RepID=UPI00404B6F88